MSIIIPRPTRDSLENILATNDVGLFVRYQRFSQDRDQLIKLSSPLLKLLEGTRDSVPSTVSLEFQASLIAPHGLKFAINAWRDKLTMPYTTIERNNPQAAPIERKLPSDKALLMDSLEIRIGPDQLSGSEEPLLYAGRDQELDYSVALPVNMGNAVWSIALDPAYTPVRSEVTA